MAVQSTRVPADKENPQKDGPAQKATANQKQQDEQQRFVSLIVLILPKASI